MERFFASGHAIDLVIAVLVLEALWLRGVREKPRVLPAAWRAAQSGAAWFWVAAALTAAGAAHAWDVWQRWPKR
jgi:hypothetical protein